METGSWAERTHSKVVAGGWEWARQEAGRPGEVAAGGLGKASVGGAGSPTFACR